MGTGLAKGEFFGRKSSFYPVLVHNFFSPLLRENVFPAKVHFILYKFWIFRPKRGLKPSNPSPCPCLGEGKHKHSEPALGITLK